MRINFSYKSFSYFLIVVLFISANIMNAQQNFADLWSDISETGLDAQGTRYIIPESYRTLELDLQSLSTALTQVPKESSISVSNSGFLLSLPLPDNSFITFKVVESPVMAEELAAKYPQIKTYEEHLWAELQDSFKTPIDVSLSLLESLHKRWAILLRSLTDKQFEKTFQHPEWGNITLSKTLALYAWHSKHHLAHITELKKKMGW